MRALIIRLLSLARAKKSRNASQLEYERFVLVNDISTPKCARWSIHQKRAAPLSGRPIICECVLCDARAEAIFSYVEISLNEKVNGR
jgi:hypothetical protein